MILHLASSPTKSKTVDVEGTSRLMAAAQRCGAPHLVYVSIVGVDRIPWPYYRSKLAAEESVAASGLPYSIQRMTQFHDFILLWLWYGSRLPVAVVPRSMSAQPLDVRDASTRLLHLLDERPQGRVPDMGGPEVLDAAALMRVLLSALDSHKRVVGVPIPGGVASGFRSGYHLTPEHADGSLTFASFVSEHLRRDGDEVTVEVPYRGSRRV